MIYDCFAFFNELDLLEIRLNELDSVVDKFVLVESTKTFQKQPKPLYYSENKERYKKFSNKIIHIVVDRFPGFFYKFRIPKAWDYDNYQKNQIAVALRHCDPNDVIIYSDLDEIPNPDAILANKDLPGYKVFQMRHFYYYLNGLEIDSKNQNDPLWWYGSVMCHYNKFTSIKKLRMQRDIKRYENNKVLLDSGWHFAYLGGIEKIIQKINSYAHTEHNNELIKNPERIWQRIKAGKGLYDDSINIKYVDLDNSFPNYLNNNLEKYSHLLFR